MVRIQTEKKNFTIDFMVVSIYFVCLVPYWNSIRFSIAFIGFLGMVTHFLQRTNISIALVCMVNHTAIEHYYSSTNKLVNNETRANQIQIEYPEENNCYHG